MFFAACFSCGASPRTRAVAPLLLLPLSSVPPLLRPRERTPTRIRIDLLWPPLRFTLFIRFVLPANTQPN